MTQGKAFVPPAGPNPTARRSLAAMKITKGDTWALRPQRGLLERSSSRQRSILTPVGIEAMPPEPPMTPRPSRTPRGPLRLVKSEPTSPVAKAQSAAHEDMTREQITASLTSYVEELKSRKFVIFPSNFDDVVDVMRRADLKDEQGLGGDGDGVSIIEKKSGAEEAKVSPSDASSSILGEAKTYHTKVKETRPWTHYLLEEGLAQDEANSKPTNPPSNVLRVELADEDKLMRGLAKIRELDIRLSVKELQQRTTAELMAFRVEEAREKLKRLVQSLPWESIPRKAFFEEHRTERTRPHVSQMDRDNDETISKQQSSSSSNSPLSSARTSISDIFNGRTTFLTDGGQRGVVLKSTPTRRRQQQQHGLGSDRRHDSSGPPSSSRSSKYSRSSRPDGPDFIQVNKELSGLAFKTRLTREDEARYRALLGLGAKEAGDDGTSAGEKRHNEPEIGTLREEEDEEEGKGEGEGELSRAEAAGPPPPMVLEEEEYGLSEEARRAIMAIDERLESLTEGCSGPVTALSEEEPFKVEDVSDRADDASEKLSMYETVVLGPPADLQVGQIAAIAAEGSHGKASAATSSTLEELRTFLNNERERVKMEHRLAEIDALLDEYQRMDPAGHAGLLTPATPTGTSAISPRSDASKALTMHSVRSARRPITRSDIANVIDEARQSLGRDPAEAERQGVVELIRKLKSSETELEVPRPSDEDRDRRLRESLARTAEILRQGRLETAAAQPAVATTVSL